MALSNIEKHYNKHPEDLRLLRRHGIVEFETTMHHLRRFLKPDNFLLDIGAGTGRYTSALMAEGYKVKAVELVRRNIEVFLKKVQKNLDNYIYIYMRRFLRNKGRAYNTVCQLHKTSFRQRGENTSPSGLASG